MRRHSPPPKATWIVHMAVALDTLPPLLPVWYLLSVGLVGEPAQGGTQRGGTEGILSVSGGGGDRSA